MKYVSLALAVTLLGLTATGHAESIYKLQDESGATVYSDRPNLQGTTKSGTVEITPGPSAEEQQAAQQRVQQMEAKSDEMRQSRMNNTEQKRNDTTIEEIESSGVGVVDDHRRPDPKARIPVETPNDGEHPIYSPGKERPAVAPNPNSGRRAGR
jgi:TolA-binding protein